MRRSASDPIGGLRCANPPYALHDFVDAITNKRPPLSGLEDGVRNVALMDRAWEATSLRAI